MKMKIVDLKADMRNIDVLFRVITKGEIREIQSRDGKELKLSEVEVGDSTGRIFLSFGLRDSVIFWMFILFLIKLY